MTDRAKARGFESPSAYIRYLIQEDANAASRDDVAVGIVAALAEMHARIQTLATTSQTIFTTAWAIVEALLNGLPGACVGETEENRERLREIRRRIVLDVRKNPVLKEVTDGQENEAQTSATA